MAGRNDAHGVGDDAATRRRWGKMSTHVGRHVSCLATYSACERRSRRDPLVARLRAFGLGSRPPLFFPFSEFHVFTESNPIDPHGIYSSNGPNTHGQQSSIHAQMNTARPSTNSSRRTRSTCASHRRGTFTFRPSHRCRSSRRAAREACSTSGRRSLLRGAIASCIARGADADAVAPHPSSRWETAFPSALWRQDRGAKRANRRVDVVLLQVRPRPPVHPIDDDDGGVA